MASPEFDALMATTQLEREKADGIKSLIAASRLAADYQHRAEKAEAALARVYVLIDDADGNLWAVRVESVRDALKEPK